PTGACLTTNRRAWSWTGHSKAPMHSLRTESIAGLRLVSSWAACASPLPSGSWVADNLSCSDSGSAAHDDARDSGNNNWQARPHVYHNIIGCLAAHAVNACAHQEAHREPYARRVRLTEAHTHREQAP